MNQCLQITACVGLLKGFLHNFVQKKASQLKLEGVAQLIGDDKVKIVVCGVKDNIDIFVDALHSGSSKFKLDEIQLESFLMKKNYRGVFRVIE